MSDAPARTNLLGLTLSGLEAALRSLEPAPYRARQIHAAIHERGERDFTRMTELPKALRGALAERFSLELPTVAERRRSDDGTVKYLLRLPDGASIETVDIPEGRRRTVCVSSQAGCALACRFCVTGYWGAGRNLEASEIVGQVLLAREHGAIEDGQLNLVLMGMGEPLLNLDAVHDALEVLSRRLAWRRITLSTAGVLPGIERVASWAQRPNLAVSLHASDDERRSLLMPINRSYPLADLIGSLQRFPTTRQQPLSFEYTVIRDLNDGPGDVAATVRLLRGLRAKLNLIPLNPDPVLPAGMVPAPMARVEEMQREFVRRGLPCSVRRPRGDDVSAACGQLRAFARPPRGFTGVDRVLEQRPPG